MKTKVILLCAVAALLPLGVNAEGSKATGQPGFSALDKNQDGYLNQSEVREHKLLKDQWSAADTNQDGRISESEFSAFEEEVMTPEASPPGLSD
ncbi:MAG: EF-hand domain-containing protein [Gammaproteobacteria bacterium]